MTTAAADGAPRARHHAPMRLTGSQQLMILVLSMTLYSAADVVADLLPKVRIGGLELEIAYFAFLPAVLAALLAPLWVALGVAIGETVIADMLLGSFSGIGELEGFGQAFVGTYVAGCLVRDPRRPVQVFAATTTLVAIDKVSSGALDVARFGIGIDPSGGREAGGGLTAVLLAEGIELLAALVVTGVLAGGLVAIWLAPRLYGKIEPILGLRPRDPADPPRLLGPLEFSFRRTGGPAPRARDPHGTPADGEGEGDGDGDGDGEGDGDGDGEGEGEGEGHGAGDVGGPGRSGGA